MYHVPVPSSLASALGAVRNPDGGWGYYPGKKSRIEPTCWALMALGREAGKAPDVEVLVRWPRRDGWLEDVTGVPINVAFNALAAITLRQNPATSRQAEPLIKDVVQARGVRLDPSSAIRQDNSLQAWAWIDQTFSWVEPTAWCLLLLKQARTSVVVAGAAERIQVGERMLLDRACASGGWNYGGSNVYGQELFAYIPTTALGVLALQDKRDTPEMQKAMQFLTSQSSTEPSAVALGMTSIALRQIGVAGGPAPADVLARAEVARAEGQVLGMATALYATSGSSKDKGAFGV